MSEFPDPGSHPFARRPHRTLAALSLPVLLSLIAEPLAGVADTAFVARLGSVPLAALGVSTALLSSVFWVFNFLGVGTQTEVSRCVGAGEGERGRRAVGMALFLACALGAGGAAASLPWLGPAARWMGATGSLERAAVTYLEIRLLGAPAMLAVLVQFGALRGLQDMRTPLWIAAAMSGLNVALDAVLIFGAGPIPALGVAGAAWATTASQWLGALCGWVAVRRRPGISARLELREALALLVVGRDMILRTGLLLFFMLLATRAATRIGAEAGAAHQAVRQLWMLSALILDAYAASAQSLVAYFMGSGHTSLARRVARVSCEWSLITGAVLALALWGLEAPLARLLVPPAAHALFASALWVLALAQPLNGLSFATDGIHWGTGDYAYLRNGMVLATGTGCGLLLGVDVARPEALVQVWIVTAAWIGVRALWGVARVWPGIGAAPLDTPPV